MKLATIAGLSDKLESQKKKIKKKYYTADQQAKL